MWAAAKSARRSHELSGGCCRPVCEPGPAVPKSIPGLSSFSNAGAIGASGGRAALARVGFAGSSSNACLGRGISPSREYGRCDVARKGRRAVRLNRPQRRRANTSDKDSLRLMRAPAPAAGQVRPCTSIGRRVHNQRRCRSVRKSRVGSGRGCRRAARSIACCRAPPSLPRERGRAGWGQCARMLSRAPCRRSRTVSSCREANGAIERAPPPRPGSAD